MQEIGESMTKDIGRVKKVIRETAASNSNALYKSHLYWSQKPYNICDLLINEFSEEGDVVLDPFMGSGVTLFQSINESNNRKGIGVEINDLPIFIVDTLLRNYDSEMIKNVLCEFKEFAHSHSMEYKTKCRECGEEAYVTKVLFDRENYMSEPIITSVHYKCKCTKKTLSKSPEKADYQKMHFGYKPDFVEDKVLITNSRIAVSKGQRISSIFTSRNFRILDRFVGFSEQYEDDKKELVKYVILSILHLSKITDTHSNSQWPLWTPKRNCVEKNIIDIVDRRVKLIENSLNFISKNYPKKILKKKSFSDLEQNSYCIIQKGIQDIDDNDIPENSVDLVITDPPYLGQVLYSEYMQLYEPFLGLGYNLIDEIVVSTSPEREKKEDEYYSLMYDAFSKISSKLKDGAYMCMYFHDSNLIVWDRLIAIFNQVGLRYLTQVHVEKKNTLKNIISPKKSLNGDAILFFVKESKLQIKEVEVVSIEEMERNIVKHAKYIIKKNGPQSTPRLYDDGLMEFVIHNGWLSALAKRYKSFVEIFDKYLIWDENIGKWNTKKD